MLELLSYVSMGLSLLIPLIYVMQKSIYLLGIGFNYVKFGSLLKFEFFSKVYFPYAREEEGRERDIFIQTFQALVDKNSCQVSG